MKSLLLAPALIGAACAAVNYDGYKVFRVPKGDNAQEIEAVISGLKLATWKNNKLTADIVVAPKDVEAFEYITANVTKTVMHSDLGKSLRSETMVSAAANGDVSTQAADLTWFNNYHAYADHLTFLKDLQAAYPTRSELFTAGTSNGGRAIQGIRLWGATKGKPAIVLHSTVHAREWITTMVNEYIAYTLATGYATDATIKGYLDKYDFHIIPVVNPDGFVFTQTSNRLWRKNRQTNAGNTCIGRDINRNWNFAWSQASGASTDPCAEDYKGAAASDATENKALASHLASVKASSGLKLYIDWHSYSQLAMYPYGYSCTAKHPKATEYQSLVNGASSAIASKYGTRFTAGPICTTIYPASGTSVDYVSEVTKGDYSFTFELRDTGNSGFVLPAAQILPSGRETWDGFAYLLKNMK